MFKSILVAGLVAAAGVAVSARAAEGAPTAQQSRMAVCNKEAVGKKGDERKAFMKQCLSAKSEGRTVSKSEGKSAAKR